MGDAFKLRLYSHKSLSLIGRERLVFTDNFFNSFRLSSHILVNNWELRYLELHVNKLLPVVFGLPALIERGTEVSQALYSGKLSGKAFALPHSPAHFFAVDPAGSLIAEIWIPFLASSILTKHRLIAYWYTDRHR